MDSTFFREYLDLLDIIEEGVDTNVLYHSVESAEKAKAILNSGVFKPGHSSQYATDVQAGHYAKTVSFGRNLAYQISGKNVDRKYQVVFVIDRNKLAAQNKLIKTSQSRDVRGQKYGPTDSHGLQSGPASINRAGRNIHKTRAMVGKAKALKNPELAPPGWETSVANADDKDVRDAKREYIASKSGGEFEEVLVLRNDSIPWKPFLIGFFIVPGTEAENDQELQNSPYKIDPPREVQRLQTNVKPAQRTATPNNPLGLKNNDRQSSNQSTGNIQR